MNPKILWLIDKVLSLFGKVLKSIPALLIGFMAIGLAIKGENIIYIFLFVLMFTIAFYD